MAPRRPARRSRDDYDDDYEDDFEEVAPRRRTEDDYDDLEVVDDSPRRRRRGRDDDPPRKRGKGKDSPPRMGAPSKRRRPARESGATKWVIFGLVFVLIVLPVLGGTAYYVFWYSNAEDRLADDFLGTWVCDDVPGEPDVVVTMNVSSSSIRLEGRGENGETGGGYSMGYEVTGGFGQTLDLKVTSGKKQELRISFMSKDSVRIASTTDPKLRSLDFHRTGSSKK